MVETPGAIALAYADCLLTGDFERLVALHHPDLVCSLLGTTLVSGRFAGRDAFFAHTFRHVLEHLAPVDEIYLKGHHLVAEDETRSALLLHGGLPTKDGGRYDQNYLQLFRIEHGLIVETHELLDTVMVETQLFSRTLATPRTAPVPALRPAPMRPAFAPPPGRDTVRALAERLVAALTAQDGAAALAVLDRGVVLQVAGTTPVSGIHRGADWLAGALAQNHGAALAPGTLRFTTPPRVAVAGDGGFVVLFSLAAETRDGEAYAQHVGLAARCGAGAVEELHVYFDTALDEARIFANPLGGTGAPSPGERFDLADHFA